MITFLLACLYFLCQMPATDTAGIAHIFFCRSNFFGDKTIYRESRVKRIKDVWRPYWRTSPTNQ